MTAGSRLRRFPRAHHRQRPPHISLQTAARLILASASPRRLQLLAQVDIVPDAVDPADLDESAEPGELARPHAERLALAKAATVSARNPKAVVLAADTVVACGRRILPKAETADQARACLALLSGRRHRVYGGIVVRAPHGVIRSRTVVTIVKMKRLTDAETDAYIASGEWQGKAGGYAIQGRAAAFITEINGSYTNVVGLCLPTTVKLLAEFR